MAMIAHPHIKLDEQGVAWIDDANVKVIEVVMDRLAHYDYDHQATLDAEIARLEQTARQLQKEAGDSPLAARLKARGLLS